MMTNDEDDHVVVHGVDITIHTGDGHDRVEISVDPDTDERIVVVNGVASRYQPTGNIVIRAGEGDDVVIVAPGTAMRVTIFGGPGDDRLYGGDCDDELHGEAGHDRLYGGDGHDRIWGGDGRDYIDGGPGNDTLLGGRGNDTVYGLGGDDQLHGGGGNDYLEGGTGNDTIDGGRGNDAISGGPGDDTIRGGPSHDRLYAGPGADTIDGGAGADVAYVQADDTTVDVERVVTITVRTVAGFIKIEGSPEFVERVCADLDMLQSSPRGQSLLAAIEEGVRSSDSRLAGVAVVGRLIRSDTLTIREYVSPSKEEDNSFAHSDTERRRRGQQMLVEYQTDLDDVYDGPPITVLYHELAHVYDYAYNTVANGVYTRPDNPGVDNAERVATGLPIDHDNDPSTPDQLDPRHPYDYTENALREEIGAPRAPKY